MNGYIKLYRSLMDWEWYQDGNALRVFLHLLLDANHKQNKWRGIEVMPGQTITSYEAISSKTGISIQSVRTSIKRLKSTGEITSISTNKYTLITIENWASYQNDDCNLTSKSTGNLTINQQATNKQLTTNKNDKKEKNEKKGIYGEFKNVLLTETELEKLKAEYSDSWQACIEFLSLWIEEKSYKSKSHYLAIRRWVHEAVMKKKPEAKKVGGDEIPWI